ncbi:putative integrase [Vibrio ichthyoenteri ATCC 700023]|uniref:Putative integrase n=1 Tax=Vibrio ichthyoenteri ATCC 700023 TaxID=870968 RepID=F9S8F6_9VIBR|nr:tyrosine-type recombinase/integrase [Vibrio ichthyoenteri]EGU29632.1 putative integrase [Vibrio ichthyoenteri ATCC 700023]
MASSDTKHLKLRGNVWWYQRRIPKALLEQFGDQTTVSESLGTGDIREARRKRDILNGKFEERRFNAPNADRHRFLELIKNMSEDKERFPASWDEHYDLDKVQRDNDDVFIHAYTTVNGRKDHRSRYRITLKEALNNWVKKFQASQTKDNVRKVKQAADKFLKYLGLYDIQLEDITKQQVNEYIEHLQVKYKKSTVQGIISRLRSIWNYADSLGEITARSPFEKNIYATGDKVEKKQPFTADEMTWIKENVATDEPDKRLLVELAVFTGCRISELCNLQAKHVIVEEDITAIYIATGKTEAAERVIPLTDHLGSRVRAMADSKQGDELLLGFDNSSDMSRWFSRIKTDNVSTDSAKCFHSFRVMFSTAMQQAGVDELKAAAILGHKRGNTMTYGYYSRGYELQQLKEAYDRCVERIIW